jgi:hypothetical protein
MKDNQWLVDQSLKMAKTKEYYHNLSDNLKKEHIQRQLESAEVTNGNSDYRMFEYKIGTLSDTVTCCKRAFCQFFSCNSKYVQRKKPLDSTKSFSDNRLNIEKSVNKELRKSMSRPMYGLMHLDDTDKAELTYCWMRNYFSLVGDPQPNKRGEIHIEEGLIKRDTYETYHKQFETMGLPAANEDLFLKIWKSCFSYVKVRVKKAVDTKCFMCTTLSFLQKNTNNDVTRRHILKLK